MKDEFIDIIKSKGYWRINFRPLGPPRNHSMAELKNLVRENNIQLRGWYYPFFRDGSDDHYGLENHNNYLGGWIDWNEYKEFWRLYRSGQFLHYDTVKEDWMGERDVVGVHVEPGKYLNFIGSLTYYVTEITEFLTRLYKSGLYPEGARLSIELHNTRGRQLASFEAMRHLSFPKITHENVISFQKDYSPDKLAELPADLAIVPLLHFFEMFGFGDVSVEQVIKKDQETLYGYKDGQRG